MTAAFWLVPALLLASGGGAPQIGESCEKTCEKRYVPCKDARVDQQMMCFEVQRRCEIRCEPAVRTTGAAKGRRSGKR